MNVYSKQRAAIAFCALSVPSVMLLAKTGWLWATAAAVAGSAICLLARNKSLPKITLAWNFVALGAAADLLCSSFENGSILLGLLLLLLAAYAASRRVVARAGAVAAFFLIILYSMLLGFSLPSVDNFTPRSDVRWYLLSAALTPMLFVDEGVPKASLGTFVLLTALTSLVTAGNDFLTAMKSVSILGIMQRLEPLASVAMTLGGFCLLSTLCDVNRRLLGRAERWSAPINFMFGGLGIGVSRLLGPPAIAVGTAIFWGLIPFIPQPLEIQKKFEKNQKNA